MVCPCLWSRNFKNEANVVRIGLLRQTHFFIIINIKLNMSLTYYFLFTVCLSNIALKMLCPGMWQLSISYKFNEFLDKPTIPTVSHSFIVVIVRITNPLFSRNQRNYSQSQYVFGSDFCRLHCKQSVNIFNYSRTSVYICAYIQIAQERSTVIWTALYNNNLNSALQGTYPKIPPLTAISMCAVVYKIISPSSNKLSIHTLFSTFKYRF